MTGKENISLRFTWSYALRLGFYPTASPGAPLPGCKQTTHQRFSYHKFYHRECMKYYRGIDLGALEPWSLVVHAFTCFLVMLLSTYVTCLLFRRRPACWVPYYLWTPYLGILFLGMSTICGCITPNQDPAIFICC